MRSRGPDPISPWRALLRKLATFRSVAHRESGAPLTSEEALLRLRRIGAELGPEASLARLAHALWAMEHLGFVFARGASPERGLAEADLPPSLLPIAHVGAGVGAVERAGFDPAAIRASIAALARPDHRGFAVESIGAMLKVYEEGWPRRLLGLRPLPAPPSVAAFLRAFPPEEQALIAHGYGRLIYFGSFDLGGALRQIRARAFLEPRAALRGVAFACAMVNHRSLAALLEHELDPGDPRGSEAFGAGLIEALVFWEWLLKGSLSRLPALGPRGRSRREEAGRLSAEARARGWPRPFGLELA